MKARIFKPAKNAMQSGRANSGQWLLEYELETPRRPEPLMGWTASGDTLNSVRLKFDNKEAAIAFAESKGMDFIVSDEHQRIVTPRSYLDNFKYRPADDQK
ncbi:MAG TPA: ETC complex I subunit [Patescibacteria group bacterium]|nr:ETC complex I subunit [Patescibacteria group bacterium]